MALNYPTKCPGVVIDGQISVCYDYNTITNIPMLQLNCLLMCTNVYKTCDDLAHHGLLEGSGRETGKLNMRGWL